MPIHTDIAAFLRSNPHVARINFRFDTFKVWPGAYQTDVANAVATEEIKVRLQGAGAGAGAAYDMAYDSLELSPTFRIANVRDQAYLVHECTHAHLDIRATGSHSSHANEAVAYLAEAIFLESQKQPPLGTQKIRAESHRIARLVLAGAYQVKPTDAAALTAEVARHPHYASKAHYHSNGFKRGIIHQLLR